MFQRHPIQCNELMFITTNVQDRNPVFQNPAFAKEAVETLYRVQQMYPFFLHAFVIMPDHCHFLLKVPEGGPISKIMRAYKYGLTFNFGIGAFWQSRFHIKIPDDASPVLHYIHLNPVKAGLVEVPEEYTWSSACGRWDVSPIEYF